MKTTLLVVVSVIAFNLLAGLMLEQSGFASVYSGPAHFTLAMSALFGLEIFIVLPFALVCRWLWRVGSRAKTC